MMILPLLSLLSILAWRGITACDHYHDPACIVTNPLDGKHFLNQWIVHIEGGEEKAKSVAEELGFEFLKQMRTHEDHYFFRHPTDVPHRHKMRHINVLDKLKSHKDIISTDQHYVFELTLNEIDNFEDMVGHCEPLEVKITHFNPEQVKEYYGEDKYKSAFVHAHGKHDNEEVEIIYADDQEPGREIKINPKDEYIKDPFLNLDKMARLEQPLNSSSIQLLKTTEPALLRIEVTST